MAITHRPMTWAFAAAVACSALVACGGHETDGFGTGGGSAILGGAAGATSLGGAAPSSGGSPSLGGTAPTGGAGGSLSTGGVVATGGFIASGGSAAGGSAGAPSSGGSSPQGGSIASGGASTPTGGAMATGGTVTSGGSATGGSGGKAGSAGTASLGGSGGASNCSLPSHASSATAASAYSTFKSTAVTANGAGGFLRVWKPDSGTVTGSTVSEGMGYGLLLAVYEDDQTTFDQLWRYVAKYLNANGLMDWEVDPQGNVIGTGAASDGDEDLAFALLMAARRWGGRGSLAEDYQVLGTRMVDAMWNHEVDQTRGYLWKPGDAWGDRDVVNLSYFAPAFFRVFGQATGNVAGWNSVIDRNYAILAATLNTTLGNASNGLVPAWSNSLGELVSAFNGAPTHFQNDSTRTPFRIGQDWCWFGEPRAKAYLEKIASFYRGVGVTNIVDGYNLDGTPRPDHPSATVQAASFVGPAGVAFMSDPKYSIELGQAWDAVATQQLTTGTIYYQKSWTALSLLMMAGDMRVFPAVP
jgi:endo-1,4-beta-D-glucanase Y